MADITPTLRKDIEELAQTFRDQFSPPQFIPGCLVKSVADVNLYATNNGWIEAICGQHNQQRVRWKSAETVAVNDYIDVVHFPSRRLFEAWGKGGAGAIAGASGGNAWPKFEQNMLEGVNYATATLLLAAMSSGDIGYLGARSSSEAVDVNVDDVTLQGVGRLATTFTDLFTVSAVLDRSRIEDIGVSIDGSGTKAILVTDGPVDFVDVKAEHIGVANCRGFQLEADARLYDCEGIATSTGTTARAVYATNNAVVEVHGGYFSASGGTGGEIYADGGSTVLLDGPTLVFGGIAGAGTVFGWWVDILGNVHIVPGTDLTLVNPVDEFSTDGTLAGNSDTAVPTEKAVKTYVDANAGGSDNIFINGAFDVWQRSTNDTGVTNSAKYVADRWYVATSAGTLANVQRSTTVRSGARSKYSLEMVGATGVTAVDIGQRIESIYLANYKRTVAFSGYIYNGSGADFTPTIFALTPNSLDTWITSTVRNGGGSGESLQNCVNGQWTQVTWSADVSGYTNIDNGFGIDIQIPSGSLVAGDTVRFAEMNLTPGSTFAPMALTDYVRELARCLRYAYKIDNSDNTVDLGFGRKQSTAVVLISAPLPVPMRVKPATMVHNVSGYTAGSPTTTTVGLINLTSNAFLTITGALTFSLNSSSETVYRLLLVAGTSWSGASGDIVAFRNGPDVVAILSCEL